VKVYLIELLSQYFNTVIVYQQLLPYFQVVKTCFGQAIVQFDFAIAMSGFVWPCRPNKKDFCLRSSARVCGKINRVAKPRLIKSRSEFIATPSLHHTT
jgi:hypothetical protein